MFKTMWRKLGILGVSSAEGASHVIQPMSVSCTCILGYCLIQ